jgi:single-strand DNA-binding protein
MSDTITLTGTVETVPGHAVDRDAFAITSFRLATLTPEGRTNYYTTTAYRELAMTAKASLHGGDRVIVTGHMLINEWEIGGEVSTTVELEADSIGHDLAWGISEFTRTVPEPA